MAETATTGSTAAPAATASAAATAPTRASAGRRRTAAASCRTSRTAAVARRGRRWLLRRAVQLRPHVPDPCALEAARAAAVARQVERDAAERGTRPGRLAVCDRVLRLRHELRVRCGERRGCETGEQLGGRGLDADDAQLVLVAAGH